MKHRSQPMGDLKPYKIVLVSAAIPPTFSGAGDLFYKYAQRLDQRGQLAFLLCFAFGEESYQGFRLELDEDKIVRLPSPGMTRTDSLQKFVVKLWRISSVLCRVGVLLLRRRSQYDIVHVGSYSWLSAFALFWASMLGKTAVYETSLVGADDLLTVKQSLGRVKYWLITRAHAYVAISPQLYDLCRTAGIREDRLYLIGNGVDTDMFRPVDQATKMMLRRELHLLEKGPIILFVGGINERKGTDLIPAIFRGVLRAFPSACMVLVGPEDLRRESTLTAEFIRRELCQYVASGQVIFAGTVCNVQEYMQASDVFLFPSRREGFGTVLIEAMSCGLPSVVHNIEGITSFIVEDGVDGFILHDENTAAYAEAIVRVLSDATEYRAISARARQKAVLAFAAEVIDRQYRVMYEKRLARGNGVHS